MKKLLIVLFTLATLYFVLTFKTSQGNYILSYSYCDTPITYSLGSIDPRFRLTHAQVEQHVAEAAAIWNDGMRRPIFVSNARGDITIHFIYDRRQELNTQMNQLERQLDTNKTSLDPQIEAYNKRVAEYEQRVKQLNEQITYWNSRGGAPDEEYKKLTEEQAQLQAEAQSLNDQAASLRQSTRAYNSQVRELNQTVTELKQSLTIRPEEGVYNGEDKTITIYLNNTRAELIHTLAHELGHARGLKHVPDPEAIMYISSTDSTTLTNDDLRAMNDICQERNYIQFLAEKYGDLLRGIKDRLQQSSTK